MMDEAARCKVALIGLGHQAVRDYPPGLRRAQLASLTAICDTEDALLRQHEEELQVKAYSDYRDLLEAEDLDFVIVATPHNSHECIVEEAARRRVHVLKEKPFARNLPEATRMTRVCDEAGIELMMTTQRRLDHNYAHFARLTGDIGTPFFVDMRYTIFTDHPGAGWRGSRRRTGGGCIIDMGYHMIDVLIWNFGLPNRVLAECSAVARPAESYDAEDTAVVVTGAIPVMSDARDDGNIDPADVERRITPRTRAILVTHMWGMPCDMDSIVDIARRHGLSLIEDASHAHGATYHGQPVGSFGDIAAFSLQGQKTVTGGEGGILLTDDDDLYYRALAFGHYNKRCRAEIPKGHPLRRFATTGMGLKLRIHPLAAAIAEEQFALLPTILEGRRRVARTLQRRLGSLPGITPAIALEGIEPAWYALTMRYHADELGGLPIETFHRAILAEGCAEVDRPGSTCPLEDLPLFQDPGALFPAYAREGYPRRGDFPRAEAFHDTLLKVPVWHDPKDDDVVDAYVVAFEKVVARHVDLL